MCLIISKPMGIDIPDSSIFKRADKKHSDGIGIAYYKPGSNKVCIKKDFNNVDHLIRVIKKHFSKDDALLIHFRKASIGKVNKGNRHPFPLTSNKELLKIEKGFSKVVMAHNGTISRYKDTGLSDTQQLIIEILSKPIVKDNLHKPIIQRLVKDYVGKSRLSFLFNDGGFLNLGDFEEDGGCYYSNDSYKKKEKVVATHYESAVFNLSGACDGCNRYTGLSTVWVKNQAYYICDSCKKDKEVKIFTCEKCKKSFSYYEIVIDKYAYCTDCFMGICETAV